MCLKKTFPNWWLVKRLQEHRGIKLHRTLMVGANQRGNKTWSIFFFLFSPIQIEYEKKFWGKFNWFFCQSLQTCIFGLSLWVDINSTTLLILCTSSFLNYSKKIHRTCVFLSYHRLTFEKSSHPERVLKIQCTNHLSNTFLQGSRYM